MKFFTNLKFIALLCAIIPAFTLMAGEKIYLRGSCNDWGAQSKYLFTDKGDGVYTLHLDALDGQFKFATTDWSTVDLGAAGANSTSVEISAGKMRLQREGANMVVHNITNVDMTLSISGENNEDAFLTITADGLTGGTVSGLSGTLPILYIDTDPIMISKDLDDKEYRKGTYWLDANGCDWAKSIGSADEMLPLDIKARGNWTRKGFAKKPFKLKLGAKQSMCGMTKSKHYAILAHADDSRAYLRNFVGFNLGKRIGLPWTPEQQPIEVVINGDYRGIYFLTESIRIEEKRINIAELKDNETDPELCSGGYLIELDNYEEGTQIIQPEINGNDVMRVTFDTPEVYSDLQYRFVEDQFSLMNKMISDHDANLWKYMDLDMAARYYIVEEIIDHRESYHGSTYMFRDRGEGKKWTFSPLWDCGNAFTRLDVESYFSESAPFGSLWIANMRQVPGFMDKVKETWAWFWGTRVGNDGADVYSDIDAYLARIEAAAKADRARWKDAPIPSLPGATTVTDNSDLEPGRAFVKECLQRKTAWLAKEWCQPNANASEPAMDTTPAAPLPEYVASGINAINGATQHADAIYNMQGIRIAQPEKGQPAIVITNGVAKKVIF